jgi:tRNA-guanine family transglycosylase
MPVVNPNIQTIKPSEIRKFGAEMIITNSYIIYRNLNSEIGPEPRISLALDFTGR